MLSAADRQIVGRDDAVGGLALLLDPEALAGWLSERIAAPCVVDRQRMRYKPGTSCTLAFRLTTDGGDPVRCVAKTYRTDSAEKVLKTVHRASAGAMLAHDPSLALVVTTLAGDRDLPALAKLFDAESRDGLLERLLPGLSSRGELALETLRHNPERRWVGVLRSANRAPVLLRAYRRTQSHQHRRAYRVLSSAAPRTPELLGRIRRYDLLAVEWIEGRSLSTLPPEPARLEATGRALARLHSGHRFRRLGLIDPETEARDAVSAANEVAQLLPGLAPRVNEVADRTASLLEGLTAHTAMLHGDFSTDQVVIGADGEPALIDLDSARVGDPAIDLACATALLARHGAADYVRMPSSAVRALYEGYTSLLPLPSASRMSAHIAAHLLRRAVDPFREREDDWPRHTERLVELAELRLQTEEREGWATW